MNEKISYLKWSPANSTENRLKSVMKDKHKIIGNEVMETILQEGYEFMKSESKRENHFNKINEIAINAYNSCDDQRLKNKIYNRFINFFK